ncbi:hypothetical protein C9I49_04490 [Pseudomonas prosekii]|uniref:Uncharacterized protein n=1 Tax=Pseudomonas prosekii TaxID=1148509 RepID=A0A2U2DD77_9PSED|nr:hypothetical protein C9I49_04490 [Pseudomonas prosekii]
MARGLACSKRACLWRGGLPVARGLAPVGSRSGPKILGLLRSPTGASPLATTARMNIPKRPAII